MLSRLRCRHGLAVLIAAGLLAAGAPVCFAGSPRGEKYALLVGVRKYNPNELRPLPYAEADVVELARVLRASGYRTENVVLMTQTSGAEDLRFLPESSRIRRELRLLLQDRTKEDTVLVAFAGHGVQFRGSDENYFCPVDTQLTDRKSMIPLGEIYKELEQCEAGLKVLLVDACRKDPRSDNARARDEVDLESETRPQKKEPPGGVVALFSCSEGERAFEHPTLKHGVFFHFVIEGFQGAAAPGEEEVTLPDLEKFVKRRVSDFVRSRFGVRQMPELVGRSRGLVPLVSLDRSAVSQAARRAAERPAPPTEETRRVDAPPLKSDKKVLSTGMLGR